MSKVTIELSQETYDSFKSQIDEKEKKIKEKSKKMFQIKTCLGRVLYESEKTTYKDVLEEAYLKGADLEGANLEGADLKGANLKGADLKGADFYKSNFYGKTSDDSEKTKISKESLDDFLQALGVKLV